MSILDDLKNEPTPDRTSRPSEPSAELIETLNTQTEAMNNVIERMETLERQVSRLSDSKDSGSTLSASSVNAMKNSLSEIESTLNVFVTALDGKVLQESSQTLIEEAQRSRRAAKSATDALTQQLADNRALVKRTSETVASIEQRAAASIDQASARGVKSINQAAARAGEVIGERITQNLSAVNERADQITELANRIDARQAWSAAAAMALTLLPVATVVAGVWMSVAGLVGAFQWAGGALTTWGRVGKFLVAGVGTAGAVAALIWCVRWVAGWLKRR